MRTLLIALFLLLPSAWADTLPDDPVSVEREHRIPYLIQGQEWTTILHAEGLTAMDEAAKNGTEAIMTALLNARGGPNLPTKGLTPYKRALIQGNDGPLDAIEKTLVDHEPAD